MLDAFSVFIRAPEVVLLRAFLGNEMFSSRNRGGKALVMQSLRTQLCLYYCHMLKAAVVWSMQWYMDSFIILKCGQDI